MNWDLKQVFSFLDLVNFKSTFNTLLFNEFKIVKQTMVSICYCLPILVRISKDAFTTVGFFAKKTFFVKAI